MTAALQSPAEQVGAEVVSEKRCTKCGETKRLSEFDRNCNRRDGRSHWCKACRGLARVTREKTRLAAGKCAYCGIEKEPGTGTKWRCESCDVRHNDSVKRCARRAVAIGLCRRCKKRPIDSPGNHCRQCWFCRAAAVNLGSVKLGPAIADLFARQGGRCAYTGVPLVIEPGPRTWDSASLEHVVPVSRGGTNDLSNVVWVTSQVNSAKSNHTMRELLAMSRALLDTAAANGVGVPRLVDIVTGKAPWLGAEEAA